MKSLVISSTILAISLVIVLSFHFASTNHYLCTSQRGNITREKEKLAESFPKYPNTKKYQIKGSCGGPDGTPGVDILFYTSDSKQEIFSFYKSYFLQQGQDINEGDTMLCTQDRCIIYEQKNTEANAKWWNVTISF